MVSEAIIGALIGGGFAVAGSLVTSAIDYYKTKMKIESESETKHAEFLIDNKVQALSGLHRSLVDAEKALETALRQPSQYEMNRVETDLMPAVTKFGEKVSESSVFLNHRQELVMNHAQKNFLQIAIEAAIRETASDSLNTQLSESTRLAKEALSSEINEPIRRFEENVYDGNPPTEQITIPEADSEQDPNRELIARSKQRASVFIDITENGEVHFRNREIGCDGKALLFFDWETAELRSKAR